MMVRPLVLLTILGVLTYNEVDAKVNKDCLNAMSKMLQTSTKLIVPCIESMGLTTPQEKKDKALVQKLMNITMNFEDLIQLKISYRVPRIFTSFGVFDKLGRLREMLLYFLQCVMKCVMIKGKMLGEDGAVDMDLAQNMLDDLPDALKAKAGDVIQECGHHAAALDPSEASCESYRDFLGCMLDVATTMCNE